MVTKLECTASGILANKGANRIPDQGVLLVPKVGGKTHNCSPLIASCPKKTCSGPSQTLPHRVDSSLGPSTGSHSLPSVSEPSERGCVDFPDFEDPLLPEPFFRLPLPCSRKRRVYKWARSCCSKGMPGTRPAWTYSRLGSRRIARDRVSAEYI